jgi:hypothetical protein
LHIKKEGTRQVLYHLSNSAIKMELEIIILIEVRQVQKVKGSMCSLICRI